MASKDKNVRKNRKLAGKSVEKRSLAAKRGWATRRARAEERSDRAKRGWATRRARAKERSERAKRGWKTRRKNERKQRQQKSDKPLQKEKNKINSITEWETLDFSDTEEIEIVSNADY